MCVIIAKMWGFIYIILFAYPSPVGYVNDFADCITREYESKITSVIMEVKQKTGAEIVVVTIPTTKGEDITTYSVNIYTEWGIGGKDKDNGALLAVAIGDRKGWITTGYGLEGILPDATVGSIWRKVITPLFKEGNYEGGILNGVISMAEIILEEHGQSFSKEITPDKPEQEQGRGILGIPILLFLFLIFGWRILPFLLFGRMVGYWSGGSFGGSGGFGGGFGGFGGGATGGGGAGGGW